MQRGLVAVVCAVVLSWSGTGLAATLLDRSLELDPSFAPAALAGSLPTPDSHFSLMPAGSGKASGPVVDDSSRPILALALAFFIGFGTGHFVLADSAAMMFLILDAALLVGIVVVWAVGIATIAGGVVSPILFLAPLLGLAYAGVRIWEFVDVLLKSGVVGGKTPHASQIILPRTAELADTPFRPGIANGLDLRF